MESVQKRFECSGTAWPRNTFNFVKALAGRIRNMRYSVSDVNEFWISDVLPSISVRRSEQKVKARRVDYSSLALCAKDKIESVRDMLFFLNQAADQHACSKNGMNNYLYLEYGYE